MAQAKLGDSVKVHYQGKLPDGSVLGSSSGNEPLQFTLGQKQVLAGFEKAVVGMEEGETKSVQLPPEDAFGHRREEMVIEVPRERVAPEQELQVGQRLDIQQPDGAKVPARVAQVSESSVVLHANHPLAGQSILFDIELVAIGD